MRLKCLVKSIHWTRAHTSRTHFETNGQPYDITGKYLCVKFPRMKTLSAKHSKISSWEICLSMRQISLRERVEIA